MENNIRTEFEKYMDNEISDWEIVLDDETKEELKNYYEKLEEFKLITENPKDILYYIDPVYALSITVANLRAEQYQKLLENKIADIQKTFVKQIFK